jgi:predicted permease
MAGWRQDMRQAVRGTLRNRFVSGLAVVAFALGIGVTTAVFSIVNSVLLTPLAYPESDRLVLVHDTQPACSTCPASWLKYQDWVDRSADVFESIAGSWPRAMVLTGAGDPERLSALAGTASLVDVLKVPPAQGRWFSPEEDAPGGPRVAVLSHAFWQSRLGGEPDVLRRTVTLSGETYQVIGVMPAGFSYRSAEVFIPLQHGPNPTSRGSHFLQVYARLRAGVSLERAAIEMRAVGVSLADEFGHNHGIDVRSYYEAVVGGIRSSLQLLMGAVLLVLLIACANVANLLLAAGLARRRELSIRMAMGARRAQLARLLVAEGLLLAGVGGVLGVLLAQWAVKVFVALAGNQLPRAATVEINGVVLSFAAATTVAVGLLCGLWPLLRMKTRELAAVVREADTRTISGGGGRFGNGLVVAEIAIACALLVGSGLLVKNLTRLQGREAGFRTAGVVTFDVAASGPRYDNPDAVRGFFRDLHERLVTIGGVECVGLTSHLPMYNFGTNGEMTREGGNLWDADDAPLVEYRWVYGDYFQALDIPLVRGRWLDERDRANTLTVLINQAMAEKFWPGEDPIGRRFGQGDSPESYWEVVGVVGDTRSFGLTRTTPLEFYRSIEQASASSMTVVLRTRTDMPAGVITAARQIVASLDSSLPVTSVQRMDDVVMASVGQPRFLTALSTLFGTLAGLLAMVGVYGVMTYNVRRQRREFGIRLALGADAGSVRRLVIGRGLMLAGLGVGLGLIGAWGLSRWIGSMLTDVTPTDPIVFVAIALSVALVVTLASWLPARSASRVDPMVAMRE